MWTESELRPGGTYLLDDFTVVQIVTIDGRHASYRTRTGVRRRRVVVRRIRLTRLRRRLRTEVSGDFFPDVALPGPYRFVRPAPETAALQAHLAQRNEHRPFAGHC